MAQKVLIYCVKYREENKELYLPEAYHFALANEICKQLAVKGMRPTLLRTRVVPDQLFKLGKVKRWAYAA